MNMSGAWFKAYQKVGEHEGCGVLLLVAKLDVCGEGQLEPGEVNACFREVEQMVENVLGYVTTMMIVATLSLAITVPLMLWPHSTSDMSGSPSLGGGWPYGTDFYRSWLNSPALSVVYWLEMLAFSVSISAAVRGTMLGFLFYSNLAIYAPDAESKLYCMLDNVSVSSRMFYACVLSLAFLYIGLVLLAARTTPVGCITLSLGFFFAAPRKVTYSLAIAPALNQLRIARDILDRAGQRGARHVEAQPVAQVRVPCERGGHGGGPGS